MIECNKRRYSVYGTKLTVLLSESVLACGGSLVNEDTGREVSGSGVRGGSIQIIDHDLSY